VRNNGLTRLLRERRYLKDGSRVSEFGFADRLFQGLYIMFFCFLEFILLVGEEGVLTPYKGQMTPARQGWNSVFNKNRAIIENAFSRLKKYEVCRRWRGDRTDLDDTTWILAQLVNLEVRRSPLRAVTIL